MEFISNFIRRPMSLVLSESFEKTSINTSPKSPNPLDHDVTNNNSNVNSNNRPSTIKAGIQIDVGACGDGGASMIDCEQKTCQQFHSSTSSSSTTSTIEELLIQINDNLNQASLQDATDELPFEYLPNQLPTCLLLNPLATKPPSTIKLPQSPHLQPQTGPSSYAVPLSSTLAAGSALLDSSDSKLRIDSELETPRFNETHLVLNNNNNKSNKFMGLTEFDESKIPELSSHLHTNNSDQIKLTFEEDLIPTLTANSNTKLDLSTSGGSPSKTLQILTYETDTALSSDNETYAECQSFLDLVHTNPAASTRIHLGYGGRDTTSMSEADTYRSALSIYNNTAVSNALGDEHENLDATMENVDDICDELIEPIGNEQCWQELPTLPSHSTKRYSLGKDLMHTTLDGNGDEPMDVSIIQTYDLPQTKHVTMEADCLKDAIANKQAQPQSTIDNHENPIAHNRSTSPAVNEASNLSPIALVPESTLPTGSTHTYSPVLPDKSLEKRNPYVNLSIPTIKVSNTTEPRTSLGALENAESRSRLTFSVVAEPDNLSAGTSTALDSDSTKANISTDRCSQISNDEAQASASGINNEAESTLGTLEKAAPQNRLTFSYTKKADNNSPGCIQNMPEPGLDPESIQKSKPAAIRRTFTVEGAEQHIENDAFPAGACNVVEPESTLGTLADVSTANRLTFSIESEQSNMNGIGNSPVKVVTDDSYTKPKNNCNLIQDNNVDSATDITSDTPVEDHEHIVATINSPIADSGNVTRIITSTGVAVELGSPYKKILNSSQSSSSSALDSEDKMNLTLNGGSSLETAPSSHSVSVNSLLFPLKPAMHNDNFPRSPDVSKPSTFLEKSDYAANSALKVSSPKEGIECKNDSTCSSIEHNLNETKSMSSSVSSVSTTQNSFSNHQPVAAVAKNSSLSQSLLNCSFNESSLPPPSMSSSTSELHTMRIAKHHTSTVSPAPKLQSENSLNLTRSISPDTFGVPNPAELEACNESIEAMDVDCSMQATSAPQTTLSPKIQENTTSTSETCTNPCVNIETLSAKELTKSNVNDEKDILVERIVSSGSAQKTKTITIGSCSSTTATDSSYKQVEFGNEDFQNNLILNPSDFDYLLTKGNSNVEIDRSSLLLKFDPLLGVPVPVNHPQHYQQIQHPLSPTVEEDEQQNEKNISLAVGDTNKTASASNQSKPTSAHPEKKSTAQDDFKQCEQKQQQQQGFSQEHTNPKKNARMSVDVIKDMKIENENCNKTIESSNTQSDEIQNNFRMDELEKKIKNEILKTEDIEKKLKEAEQREEALIKRITDKDKTISKMNGVIEAYEKAIAELISEKEQLIQNYEKQLAEVKADRDSNYHHLNSLETTFSDLHVKYEKSKEMTSQLKSSEESLLAEKKQNLENLRLQEQRYEKMKNHAMQQLEIANKKLECLTKEHAIETTKLKALLKKEEISRASINEQLQQKSRENAELVKICDELINGQGS